MSFGRTGSPRAADPGGGIDRGAAGSPSRAPRAAMVPHPELSPTGGPDLLHPRLVPRLVPRRPASRRRFAVHHHVSRPVLTRGQCGGTVARHPRKSDPAQVPTRGRSRSAPGNTTSRARGRRGARHAVQRGGAGAGAPGFTVAEAGALARALRELTGMARPLPGAGSWPSVTGYSYRRGPPAP